MYPHEMLIHSDDIQQFYSFVHLGSVVNIYVDNKFILEQNVVILFMIMVFAFNSRYARYILYHIKKGKDLSISQSQAYI